MAVPKDLSGMKFGNLTALHIYDRKGNSKVIRWLCLCECGKRVPVFANNLARGNSKQCIECGHARTHGKSSTKLYKVWSSMKSRCSNPTDQSFRIYGGKGVSVCDEWIEFERFSEWAKLSGYKPGLTIERKNRDENYAPDNCCWIPKGEQSNNTSRCRFITYNGLTMNLKQWSIHLGASYSMIQSRLKRLGWSARDAFEKPLVNENRRNVRLLSFNGKTQSIAEWARDFGMPYKVVCGRLYRGNSLAEICASNLGLKLRE